MEDGEMEFIIQINWIYNRKQISGENSAESDMQQHSSVLPRLSLSTSYRLSQLRHTLGDQGKSVSTRYLLYVEKN